MNKASWSFLFLFGCMGQSDYVKFVDLHGDDDFGRFVNVSIYFRSLDENNNALYFISFVDDKCEAPYIVTVSKASGNPIKLDTKLREKNCGGQRSVMKEDIFELTRLFLTYQIRQLQVDSDSIVFINLGESEYPKLVKFSNTINYSKLKEFSVIRKIKKNWYLLERD